jgi:D-tyrosyl-tRNA(Tyr) deacylase
MIAVIQRVSQAEVKVEDNSISAIGPGILILLGVSAEDTEQDAQKLAQKISALRIFSDENRKMNLCITDVEGEALVVSQFTLLADATQGNRPSYIQAARPEKAIPLYESFCERLQILLHKTVGKGIFGADMKVSLINDGPVTIILNSRELKLKK